MRRLELFLGAKAANTPPRGISKASRVIFSVLTLLFLSIGQMWGENATMSYSAGSTTNMTASGNAATVGLNASLWTVTADKGGQNNYPGLNKSNYIALYAGSNSSQNGASFTVTLGSGTISSITINYKQNTGTVYVGSNAITPSNNSYTINSNSFTVKNTLTTGQVQINSISITYSTGSTPSPSITLNPTSLTFDSKEQGETAPGAKTFTITGSNLTGNLSMSASTNSDYYTWAVTSGSLTKNGSNAVSATVTVTPKSSITDEAGSKAGTITISGGGASSQTVSLSMTVTAPAHSYTYNQDFTAISFTGWSSSYDPHTVNYDLYNGHAGNDCHVTFAAASKQGSTIDNMPVAKNGAVNLILDDPNKYISAVKFVGEQWGTKAQTMVLKYSTDGGESWTAFDPAKEATNFAIEELNLPAKVNAVQVAGKNSSNQIGYASVHFDLVNKVSYNINKSETGCTLSVTNGTSAITTAEAGDEVHVSIASTETGYENASFVVKDADNADVTVTNGKFTMPAKAVTITATATETDYTVTVNQNPAVSATTTGQTTAAHYNGTINLTTTVPDGYTFVNWTSSDVTITNPTSATTASFTMPAKNVAVTANFVSASKLNPGFAWSAASAEAVKGQAASLPTLTTNPYSLTPTYVSTNTDVAEIDGDGAVTIKAVGSTTIKATYAEGETYAACEAAYTLTVKGRVTWHAKKADFDATTYADYVKDAVPTKPTGDFIASCHSSISLVGWTTEDYKDYSDDDDAPAELYTASEDMPGVTDNVDYYAVWGVVEEGGWNEITSVANLTAGTYAICSDHYFMKAVKVDNKNRLQNGGEPSISEGKLTSDPAADCQWTISKNGEGKYLFQNEDKYAIATSTKNEMILSNADDIAEDAHAQWEIARSGSIFEVTNIGRDGDSDTPANKYLRNNTTSGWACYSINQGGEGYAPRFFKYSAGSTTGYTTNCVEPMTVATPTFTPNGSAAYYTEAQNVTISCATEGSVIYYTLDNTTPSKTNGTQYTAAINVAETKTIKAIAYVGDVASEVATATFTINLPLTTIPAIFNAATTTATAKMITFDNWVVSGVKADGTQAFLTDGTNGIILFHKNVNMQLEVGNTLSGTKECSLILFNGAAELQDFSKDGLTIGTGGVVTPVAKSITSLGGVNTGAPVIINNVTYTSSDQLLSDGSNTIKPFTTLYDYTTPTNKFENDKIYNVTGIYQQYNATKEILPRVDDDIVKLSKEQQTITWYVSNAQAEAIGTSYSLDNKDVAFAPVCVSNSTGAKTYQSSNTEVATINENTGVIEVLGNGVTTITCNVVGDENYVDGSKAFTLKVGLGEASWVATTWADENGVGDGQSLAMTENAAGDNVDMTWDKGTNNNAPKYYDNGKATRIYAGNTLTLTSKNGKIMTSITFTFSVGAFGANVQSVGDYNTTNNQWTGFANSVTFTSDGSWRITQIDIEYMNGTTTTLTIADIELSMLSPAAQDIVYTCSKTNPTIVYSGYDDTKISIVNGQIAPLAVGSTNVTASIAAEAPYSSAVTTFKVTVKSGYEVEENVVILAHKDGVWYALTNTQGTGPNNSLAAIEVDYFESAGKILTELTPAQKTSITWKRITDGNSVTFQDANNKYLTGTSESTNLSIGDAKCEWTKSGDDYLQGERTFLYSTTNGYFRCYTSSTAGVTDMPIFVASNNVFGITYKRAVSGNYGTICLPNGGVLTNGALYEIAEMDYQDNKPYKIYFDEVEGGVMVAGKPYIFKPNDGVTELTVVYTDAANAAEGHYNGLYGKYTKTHLDANDGNYILKNNQYYYVNSNNVYCEANRAYIKLSEVPAYDPGKPAYGRRRIALNINNEQVATGMDELNASEAPVKVMIDGKFYILRGEKMYDATGRLVK